MPFLSRLLLNPRGRGVIRELKHPYEMHRTVLRGFNRMTREEIGAVLFRADVPRDAAAITLYVQSERKPDWSFLETWEDYLLDYWSDRQNPAVKPFSPEFQPGTRYRFRLRANPTVKRNGKRIGLIGREAQTDWLLRKAGDHGFTVTTESLLVRNAGYLRTGIREQSGDKHQMIHLAVIYDGVLQVHDVGRFESAWRKGIGPAKAFGFGMLSLKRM